MIYIRRLDTRGDDLWVFQYVGKFEKFDEIVVAPIAKFTFCSVADQAWKSMGAKIVAIPAESNRWLTLSVVKGQPRLAARQNTFHHGCGEKDP